MNLLEIILGILLKVFGQTIFYALLQFFLDVTTYITNLNLCLFSNLVTLLHQLLTTFFGRLWNSKANYLSVVVGSNADIAVHDSFLNVSDSFLVPWLDGYSTSIGSAEVSYLIQGHFHTVRIYFDAIEDGKIGTTSTNV